MYMLCRCIMVIIWGYRMHKTFKSSNILEAAFTETLKTSRHSGLGTRNPREREDQFHRNP